MANRARWTYGASFLVLSLIVSSAAFAAAENSGQEKPSQAEPDSKILSSTVDAGPRRQRESERAGEHCRAGQHRHGGKQIRGGR